MKIRILAALPALTAALALAGQAEATTFGIGLGLNLSFSVSRPASCGSTDGCMPTPGYSPAYPSPAMFGAVPPSYPPYFGYPYGGGYNPYAGYAPPHGYAPYPGHAAVPVVPTPAVSAPELIHPAPLKSK